MAVPKRITAGYPPPHTTDVLVDDRLVFNHLAAGNADNQVAVSIELQPLGAVEAELNLPWVGAWRQHEVILQLPLVTVIDQVHTGIDVGILNPGIVGHVGAPLRGIVADEVVAPARQLLQPAYLRSHVGANKPHAQHLARSLLALAV